jgi:hypothetical protein
MRLSLRRTLVLYIYTEQQMQHTAAKQCGVRSDYISATVEEIYISLLWSFKNNLTKKDLLYG